MDGPSVNRKFYKDPGEHHKREKHRSIIIFGSCNLHILHGAFKCGFEGTEWGMKNCSKQANKSCMIVPHAGLSSTESTKFPLVFCSYPWVEDKPVADRLIEIWPNIVKTCKYWTSLRKSKQPKCKSFQLVTKA